MFFPDFPNTSIQEFVITSPKDPIYNCIAWAYGVNDIWFWPHPYAFWPAGIPKELTLEAFVKLFERIGFQICNNGNYESGLDKIAIYEKDNKPTHAAKLLQGDIWSSKLGNDFDVSHTLFSMQDGFYGNVSVFMKRDIKIL